MRMTHLAQDSKSHFEHDDSALDSHLDCSHVDSTQLQLLQQRSRQHLLNNHMSKLKKIFSTLAITCLTDNRPTMSKINART